ncbi:neuropeptide-like precursor 1 isoform X1 [Anopheles maculipalpis]|uniref:neuropeptide-like precursor 1 isoform X1 n=1 Tax=Anopheles maculipalpis TaxID=1496333 RepID=UPI0021592379|nr:neuropeptide-like precursor 1 isoform X1 [Anopheles maculipalpis]
MMLRSEMVLPPKLFFVRAFLLLFLVFQNVNAQNYDSRRLKPCELESLLRDLTYPDEGYEMHAVALRNQLRHILERDPSENYQNLDDSSEVSRGPYEDKRSYRSLLRDGAVFGKRNVGALARAGLLRNQPEYLKRSLATLAKNGQLPSRDTESEDTTPDGEWSEDKRNVVSALKSGYMLNGKRNIASLARKYELPGKRNIQSLLRTGMLPSIAPKRNIQSLARENALAGYGNVDKRNIQTLVRDWSLPKQHNKLSEGSSSTGDNEKRNIQSLKNSQGGGRKKRSLYYDELEESSPEVLEPVYQTAPLDYEELMEAMVQTYPLYSTDNHLEEKRFLGLRRSEDTTNYGDDRTDADLPLRSTPLVKRHIASIVRSGWTPSFRPSRGNRFSRAGRARSNLTPDPSHYDNQPAAYVDNAFMDSEVPLVGELQGYSPRGVLRRPELPRYTGEAFASHPYVQEEYSERVNPFYTDEEYRCASRLRKLLYYLKKQYYLDNKYIQATYGRNAGYYK